MNKSLNHLHVYTGYNLGMYEIGTPAGTTKRLFGWRSLRAALPQSVTLLWLLGALGMGAALAAAGLHRSSRRQELVCVWGSVCALAGMALSQLVLVPIVSGLPGVDKHLYPFQILLDWLLVVLVWAAGRTLAARASGPGV